MGEIKIKCLKCGETIGSTYDRHFKECLCGNIWVDGGDDCLRFGGNIKDKNSYLFVRDGEEIRPENMMIKNKPPMQNEQPTQMKKEKNRVYNEEGQGLRHR